MPGHGFDPESRADRRRHVRARVKVRVVLCGDGTSRPVVVHTTTLSAGGACCQGPLPLHAGQCLAGHLYLPVSESGRDLELPLPVQATVLRVPSAGAGVQGEVALRFEFPDAADEEELRRFLLEALAEDSERHGRLVGASR